MVMEAKKSHSLLSESWRARRAAGIIQSSTEGPRRGVVGVCLSYKSSSLKAQEPLPLMSECRKR